ncbi:unnamed protein product [Caenorhabditis auriculariae]|uniref:Uncharacterized protein n=1 Tax=Caenorhabditis auriculariae TaxID=2777116 RepID=A0A8S1HJQ5_9PELO|nr:unnamed protein product [Caenorhabditis auriculariae]
MVKTQPTTLITGGSEQREMVCCWESDQFGYVKEKRWDVSFFLTSMKTGGTALRFERRGAGWCRRPTGEAAICEPKNDTTLSGIHGDWPNRK